MNARKLLSIITLGVSCLAASCGGGGGGGESYSVQLNPVGGLGATQPSYQFQVAGATDTSVLTYELDGASEQPVQNRLITVQNLEDGRHALRVIARNGTQYAEDWSRWIVDNNPPSPPTIGSIRISRQNANAAEVVVSWEAPDDGTTMSYKLYYNSRLRTAVSQLTGTFAKEGKSPLTIRQQPADRRYQVTLTGFRPDEWYSFALEATDGKQRTTKGPVFVNHSDRQDSGATYSQHSQHQKLRYGAGYTRYDCLEFGDFNGNGDVELLTSTYKRSKTTYCDLSIFRRTSPSSTTLTRAWTSRLPVNSLYGTSVQDLNGDGRMDLLAWSGVYTTSNLKPYIVLGFGRSGSGFSMQYLAPPVKAGYTAQIWYPVAGQFDGDGITDIAAWAYYSKSGSPSIRELVIYYGSGTVSRPGFAAKNAKVWLTSKDSPRLLAADLDGDGRDELIRTAWDSTKQVYVPTVVSFTADRSAMQVQSSAQSSPNAFDPRHTVMLDRDGDGDLDILSRVYESSSRTYRLQEWIRGPKNRLTMGARSIPLRSSSSTIRLARQDRDSIPDLLIHYPYAIKNLDTIAVHKGLVDSKTGKPTGQFGNETLLSISSLNHSTSNHFTAGDLDRDGFLDFASCQWNSKAQNYYFGLWDSSPRQRLSTGNRVYLGGSQETKSQSGALTLASPRGVDTASLYLGHEARAVSHLPMTITARKKTGAFGSETRIDLDAVLPAGLELASTFWADANRDGLDDLYYSSKNGELGMLQASWKGSEVVYANHPLLKLSAGIRVDVARFDRDSRPDFGVLFPTGIYQAFMLRSTAAGWELTPGRQISFTGTPGVFTVRDFNGDGYADVVAQTKTAQSKTGLFLECLFTATVSGSRVHEFSKSPSYTVSSEIVSMHPGHFRYQSQNDLMVLTKTGEVWIYYLYPTSQASGWYLRSPRRIFTSSSLGGKPRMIEAIEFTNDGYTDIFVASGTKNTAWIYYNRPTTTYAGSSFSRYQTLTLPMLPTRVRSLHLNDDPFADLVIGNASQGGLTYYLGYGSLR